MAEGTGPSGSRLPLPQLSLTSGMPKRMTAGTPTSAAARASSTTVSADHWNCPGIETMGFLTPVPRADEERIDEVAGGQEVGLPDQGPHAGRKAQAAHTDRTREAPAARRALWSLVHDVRPPAPRSVCCLDSTARGCPPGPGSCDLGPSRPPAIARRSAAAEVTGPMQAMQVFARSSQSPLSCSNRTAMLSTADGLAKTTASTRPSRSKTGYVDPSAADDCPVGRHRFDLDTIIQQNADESLSRARSAWGISTF